MAQSPQNTNSARGSVKIRLMNPDECEQVWQADVEAFKNSPFGELTGMKKKTDEELKNWQSGGEKFRTLYREHPDQVIVAVTEDGVAGCQLRVFPGETEWKGL